MRPRQILQTATRTSAWSCSAALRPTRRASWGRRQSSRVSTQTTTPLGTPSPPQPSSGPSVGGSESSARPPLRDGRPFRMAVVGSGPAGFYTAHRVMSRLQDAKVDMYEALPVPFGLIRFGVAPDHPEVKNCQVRFDEIASSPNFTFVGNMSVGTPSGHPGGGSVRLSHLMGNYDAVVFAYGAAKDRNLWIPGEDLKGVRSARQFVGWYNGLPEHVDLEFDLTSEETVIIGQGNVALDVARILLADVDVLRRTDIAEHAIEALSRSRVKRVHVVGRRGPVQAAFTIKEARELMNLPNVGFHGVKDGLIPTDRSGMQRPLKRLMELLLKGSSSSPQETPKSWSLDFCLKPLQFKRKSDDMTRLGSVEFEQVALRYPFDPAASEFHSLHMGTVNLKASTAFKSIGYRAEPLQDFLDVGIHFNDQAGVIYNDGDGGRVEKGLSRNERKDHPLRGANAPAKRSRYPGLYCAGWVKRGPTGVIASTMQDAFATADAIVQDWQTGAKFLPLDGDDSTPRQGWDAISRLESASQAKVVSWDDWRKIDEVERERGRLKGKEREKLPTTSEMLSVVS